MEFDKYLIALVKNYLTPIKIKFFKEIFFRGFYDRAVEWFTLAASKPMHKEQHLIINIYFLKILLHRLIDKDFLKITVRHKTSKIYTCKIYTYSRRIVMTLTEQGSRTYSY